MILSILVGGGMIVATTLIHAGFMMVSLGDLRERARKKRSSAGNWRPAFILSVFVLWMFLASVVEVWLWSALYLLLGVFDALEIAVYFSTVTFTTLGYGDVVLAPPFRLLSSFQAVNGLILFGWTTALVFAVVQWLYKDDRAVGEHVMRPPRP